MLGAGGAVQGGLAIGTIGLMDADVVDGFARDFNGLLKRDP